MFDVLENGWVLGGKNEQKTVMIDDYGEEIYEGCIYYYDEKLGVMSEETYDDLVKYHKTVYDAIATERLVDIWNGEIIEIGERYLNMNDGPWKIFDDTKMSDIAEDVSEMVA